MTNNISLSIIIPMYNAAAYIGACLDSIQRMGLDEGSYEVIVIDDGSRDNGGEVVARYPEVQYVRQENQGLSATRNRGIGMARGKYIWFVDSDDEVGPDSIQPVLDFALTNDLDMVTFGLSNLPASETPMSPIPQDEDVRIYRDSEYLAETDYYNNSFWYLIKRSFLGDLRFHVNRFVEDGMFTMELLMRAYSVAHFPLTCYCYIQRPGSIMNNRNMEHGLKLADDYLYSYHQMSHLVEQYRASILPAAARRCEHRAETYLFFMLTRLMRLPHGSKHIRRMVQRMKTEGIYPIPRIDPDIYKGVRYNLVTFVVNHPAWMGLVNRIFTILRVFTSR